MMAPLTRRQFGLLASAGVCARSAAGSGPDFSSLPNFCSHEHWGSIDSIGMAPEGFRADVECGATPRRRTGILDLLLEPYLTGLLSAAGAKISEAELRDRSSWEAVKTLRPALRPHEFTGTFQCTRRGLLYLYGADLWDLDRSTCMQLDDAIARNYANHLDWYQTVMRKRGFSQLIRPVHPEFYVRQESPEAARHERSFTHTVMRIDPLLDLWRRDSARRKGLAAIAGVEPGDAKTWRTFLGNLFDLAARNGAVGTKQLEAYSRDLDFVPRVDSEVVWSGDLTPPQVRIFQDWVVHECSKQAHDRGWPHQVHVGTHNLTQSSPMPLATLARRYRRMKIVMIHCWPFLNEAGWLAKYEPNLYIDTCWQPVLNPEFLRNAMRLWLNYVPSNKITCGHDATTVEMAAGSALFTREILAETISNRAGEKRSRQLAADLLHNNAVEIYGIGQRVDI